MTINAGGFKVLRTTLRQRPTRKQNPQSCHHMGLRLWVTQMSSELSLFLSFWNFPALVDIPVSVFQALEQRNQSVTP